MPDRAHLRIASGSPRGLLNLSTDPPGLIPWVWAVNGFALVLAAPLATVITITWGYRYAGQIAIVLYSVAGTAFAITPIGLGHE